VKLLLRQNASSFHAEKSRANKKPPARNAWAVHLSLRFLL